MTYLPHQQRVVDEKRELDVKLDALRMFIFHNEVFNTLPAEDQQLLRDQRMVMSSYSHILCMRIDRFSSQST